MILAAAPAGVATLVMSALVAGGRHPARASLAPLVRVNPLAQVPAVGTADSAAPFRPSAPPASVVAAEPFHLGPASAVDRGRALECLTAAVYYEAGAEPQDGQRAVAQAVLNRVRHPAFPATVCGVVYEGSAHARCQFAFACDGTLTRRRPEAAGWARATRIAAQALAGQVYAPVGLATHYHTFAVAPAWNRGLVMTDVVGAHVFHRWKGSWGTAAAFGRRYLGGEPLPGPLATPASPTTSAAFVTAATMPAADTLSDQTTPSHAEAAVDLLPPAASVLPRWRHAGEPLR